MNHKNNLPAKLSILSIQLTFFYIWILAAIPKLSDADYLQNFQKRFAGSWLEMLPGGITLQVYFLGILELLAAGLFLIALIRREFWTLSLCWTKLSLAFSALTFLFLGFGLRAINDFAGSANIFFYLSGTIVMIIYVNSLNVRTQE